MKVTLNVPERLNITEIIMSLKYNRALLQSAYDTVEALAFTKEEIELNGIKSKENGTSWEKNIEMTFDIPDDVIQKVETYFNTLLDREQMQLQLKSLYDKFQIKEK